MRISTLLLTLSLTACLPADTAGTVELGGGDAPGGGGTSTHDYQREETTFGVTEGVSLSGTITVDSKQEGELRIDILLSKDGDMKLVHTQGFAAAGPFEIIAPPSVGDLFLVAYLDTTGKGPVGSDPVGLVDGAVSVGTEAITGLDMHVSDATEFGAEAKKLGPAGGGPGGAPGGGGPGGGAPGGGGPGGGGPGGAPGGGGPEGAPGGAMGGPGGEAPGGAAGPGTEGQPGGPPADTPGGAPLAPPDGAKGPPPGEGTPPPPGELAQ